MITRFDRLRRPAAPRDSVPTLRAIGVCALSIIVGTSLIGTSLAAAAEHASRWDGDARSAVRLIAGSTPTDKTAPIRAGIEVRIKAGWHTYWRYPGDAGVPPRIDFAGSQNVKSVDVLWPAPKRIPEEGLVAIGYVGDMIWPLAIVPQNRVKPVTLRLKLDYAVCEKLCVPAEGKAELTLPGGASSQDAALAGAESRVPKKLALGDGSPLAVKSVRRIVAREDGRKHPEDGHKGVEERPSSRAMDRPRVIVDVAVPAGARVALFAEGPTPDWALPVPMAIDGAPPGLQRFAFDLDGAPPGAKYDGAAITLTAVAGDLAIEVTTRLD